MQLQLRQGAAQVGWQVYECHPPNLSPSGPSAHELRVALGTRYYDIHPDPHGLRGWGHHVVEAVVGLHTEGQRRVRALEDHITGRGGDFLEQRLQAAPVASFSSETFVKTTEYIIVFKIQKKKKQLNPKSNMDPSMPLKIAPN